ncbi:hypothetical protein [Vibrio gazogenes]|uniref:hypothetical protein n=1 Tax=Vibrio gazogenes TaxID=687 RepID=UPI0012FD7B77|nr:hypothetical protein [Vibrio gazogenes]
MEEWLGFSGQDARKSWFWTTCDSVTKKDFLVRLSSLKDELAHRVPMLLKSENEIMRQIPEPKAGIKAMAALRQNKSIYPHQTNPFNQRF